MRSFIRHPSDIPITVCSTAKVDSSRQLDNISAGGLAFVSETPYEASHILRLRIDSVNPPFEIEGVVSHVRQEGDKYVIGIEFLDQGDLFTARMVEQVCHIEQYKKHVEQTEHRHLTGQQAAAEWISKYAETFPSGV